MGGKISGLSEAGSGIPGTVAKREIEEQLAGLGRLRDAPAAQTTLNALRKGLSDRVNLVVAKAAQVIGEMRLKSLIPDLLSAFDRQFKNAGGSDPQCWAKNAIAKALTDLDHDESEPFLRGCRYRQMEAVWGGKTDTAITLRSLCTLALVQCVDLPRAQKLRHLVASMTDREEPVRVDALRALEQLAGEEAALLLRAKAAIGDPRAAVVGQALESLLRIEGASALDFCRNFLKEQELKNPAEFESSAEEVLEEAALAVGASRVPAAVELLKEAWGASPKGVFLQAISVSRLESGFDFLLAQVRSGRERDALASLQALSLHRDSPEIREATETAVRVRGNAELSEQYYEKFGTR